MTTISTLHAFFKDKFTRFPNTALSAAFHAFISAIFTMAQVDQVAFVQLSEFFAALFFFHASEFLLVIIIHGASRVNSSSLLISKPYVIAMICGLIEYSIESIFVPKMKTRWWANYIGLTMVVTGEVVRKCGILTARRSFTHDIKKYLRNDHELVTYGIYR
ncbi:protein-S-isoprenylcysteine O-methyltransferase B-like [Cryptomeria japonica]|uniref:protein-S-isoprenylcysteine O-methyltransferase B-like n=1 Tax=Cryptomeria japonica TaxID=3369 RepID=UPI0027DA1818|nr:protein-S-isoprenylcysteine O-methyltransferase B-like [Cryptomeria japonica]